MGRGEGILLRGRRGSAGAGQWSGRKAQRSGHRPRAVPADRARPWRRPRARGGGVGGGFPAGAPHGGALNASVLIVDDERVFCMLAEEALTSEGFEVRTADTLRKARTEFNAATPDVLVLDRRLPDGDGIDFLKTVRAQRGPGGSQGKRAAALPLLQR
ncbi:MAG: hypothetical protein DMF81_26535 [Acidobacteria bacterium]|nr:MAG: hypothetical protein DMF81_26535 [Acidobacteriota bacterium]